MEPFSDGTGTNGHSLYDVRQRLQMLLDQKEQELQSAGSLGQRILAQQMELEERINQISELESGRTGLKDDEIESEMRAKLNDLADTMQAWTAENQQLWSGFGPKTTSDDPFGTGVPGVSDIPVPSASIPDGPSAAQSSRRAKNAAHRANDVEFAFEIGSSLLTEVRRLQALLAERDKAIQDFKEEKEDLERTIESLKTALRTQEASADKFREENWNLEVTLQEIRNQLTEAQGNAQRAESEVKRTAKQLVQVRETSDGHKNEAERLAHVLEDLKAKHETDVAQMRKQHAGLQREKQDLQTAMDTLKADMAKKARAPARFSSPMASNGDASFKPNYDLTDEEEDGVNGVVSPRRRGEPSVIVGEALVPESLASIDNSPIKSPVPNQAAEELESLKRNLSHAHQQIQLLKSRLLREKQLKSAEGKKRSVDLASDPGWLDEELGDELDTGGSRAPRNTSTPIRRHGRGGKSGRSVTRSTKGLTVIQQLNAAKGQPDSPQQPGRIVDLTADDEPEGFGPLAEEERNMFDEDEDGSGSDTEVSTAGSSHTERPLSTVSVEGMDPMFANVLKQGSPAPYAPVTPSPLRPSINNRATRRTRGGAAFKGDGRPPSIGHGQMGALAAELGFGEGDISTMTQPVEEETEPAVTTAEIGVQCDPIPEEPPAPVVVPEPPAPEPEPELEPKPETAEFGVQCEPPPVLEIPKADATTQTVAKVYADMAAATEPEPVVVPPQTVEMGTNTTELWPIIPVAPKTVDMGVATDPIPEPQVVEATPVLAKHRPTLVTAAPPSSFRDPALYSARTDTDGDETEYEDARETPGGTSRSQSAADFVSVNDDSPDEADVDEEERLSEDDSDAESIKVSRLQIRRPVSVPQPPPPPPPPPVEYSVAAVQADAPKPETIDSSTQTDDWTPPAPPALFRVGPQQQQFQFVTPGLAAAAVVGGSGSPTQAAHPPLPSTLGPSFQAAVTRSRLNTASTLPDQASIVSLKDESVRSRVPSASTLAPSPRIDRTRPPTMMLPPPPKLPPPPNTISPPPSAGKTIPPRPSSPPPADLVQRATSPLQRTPMSSAQNLAVPSPGKSSVIRQSLSTPASIRQAPSASSFRSAGVHHQSLNAAAMADLNGRKEGSMVSSRRSTSSRRASISSSISSEQQAVRMLEPVVAQSPTRANTGGTANGGEPGTDPTIIHAITQTMIGEYLYKYTRKAIGKGHAERRHKRFFWIHPYTKTIYWSSVDPGASNVHESSAKSAYIESVKSVLDPNPMPPGLHQYSVIVSTAQREMKFTAPTKERHDIWFNALNYLLARPNPAAPGSRAPLSPTTNQPRLPSEGGHRKEMTESPRSQRSGRSTHSGIVSDSFNVTPRAQRSHPRLSTNPVSIGKRAGTPAAEYLRWNGGEPGSPTSAYDQTAGGTGYDEELDFEIHEHDPEAEGFEGMENVRACCDGAHDVGTLSARRHHHHHHHHHDHDHPVPPVPPFARSQPGTARSSSRPPPTGEQHPSRPASPSGWSFRSGKSRGASSSREDGGGGGMFSWSKRSRKESTAPVR